METEANPAQFILRISACTAGSRSIELGYSKYSDASLRDHAFDAVPQEEQYRAYENFFALEKIDHRGMIFEDKIISQATVESTLGMSASELIERAFQA